MPLLYSLVGDLFPAEQRAAASSAVAISQGAGVFVGQSIAGFVGPRYGWRLPFVIVAVPALLCVGLIAATVSEPPRGMSEAALTGSRVPYRARLTRDKVQRIFRSRCNLLVFAQGLPGCVPWGVINAFFTDFLAQEKGLKVEEATAVLLAFGVGAAIGNCGGGLLGQWLYNRSKASLPMLMGATTTVGCLPLLAIINTRVSGSDSAYSGAFAWAFLGGLLSCVTAANVRAVLLNVNAPETRGTVFAVYSLMDDLGKGAGPAVVAALIVRLGRKTAFNLGISGWVLCGALLTAIARFLDNEESELQESLAARADGMDAL